MTLTDKEKIAEALEILRDLRSKMYASKLNNPDYVIPYTDMLKKAEALLEKC